MAPSPKQVLVAIGNGVVLIVALLLLVVVVGFQQLRIQGGDFLWRLVTARTKSGHTSPTAKNGKQFQIPFHPALAESACMIASKIRAGVYTSEEVVSAFIAQAERVNRCMNVICDRRYDGAIAEARSCDAEMRLRRATNQALDDLPPFYGTPCSIKEFFAMAGMLQTSGVIKRSNFRPDRDATTVKRMRDAGFIVLLNTNTSELGMWYASDNPVWGRSNNAYDHSRIVGGSSGGEAALVSAGGAPVGLGSDIGGSIRIPAGFNGVFGHKPTGGLISNSGQYPTTNQRFMVTGPICRYSDDLLPMLELLRGPDGIDVSCINMELVEVDLPLLFPVLESASPALHKLTPACGVPHQPVSTPMRPLTVPAGAPQEPDHVSTPTKVGSLSEAMGKKLRRLMDASGEHSPPFAGLDTPTKLMVVDRTGSSAQDLTAAASPPVPKGHGRGRSMGGTTSDAYISSAASDASPAVSVHDGSILRSRLSSRTPSATPPHALTKSTTPSLRSSVESSLAASMQSPPGDTNQHAALSAAPKPLFDDLADIRMLRRPPITTWESVTVYTIKDIMKVAPRFATPIQKSVMRAVTTVAQVLTDKYGCKGVVEFEMPELVYAFDMWTAVLGAAEQPTFRELLSEGYGGTLDIGRELINWCFGNSKSTLPALILALIEDLPTLLMPARQEALIKECLDLKRRVYNLLSETNGVLLLPMHPTTAPLHDVPLLRPFNVAYTQMFNVLETPVTVVPVGLDADGLPVCVQVVAAHGYDRLSIAIAQALEHGGTAGWIPPQAISKCLRCSGEGLPMVPTITDASLRAKKYRF